MEHSPSTTTTVTATATPAREWAASEIIMQHRTEWAGRPENTIARALAAEFRTAGVHATGQEIARIARDMSRIR